MDIGSIEPFESDCVIWGSFLYKLVNKFSFQKKFQPATRTLNPQVSACSPQKTLRVTAGPTLVSFQVIKKKRLKYNDAHLYKTHDTRYQKCDYPHPGQVKGHLQAGVFNKSSINSNV